MAPVWTPPDPTTASVPLDCPGTSAISSVGTSRTEKNNCHFYLLNLSLISTNSFWYLDFRYHWYHAELWYRQLSMGGGSGWQFLNNIQKLRWKILSRCEFFWSLYKNKTYKYKSLILMNKSTILYLSIKYFIYLDITDGCHLCGSSRWLSRISVLQCRGIRVSCWEDNIEESTFIKHFNLATECNGEMPGIVKQETRILKIHF